MILRPRSEGAAFIPRLESMRGIAALIVAASHVGQSPVGGGHMLVANPRPDLGAFAALVCRTYVHLTDGLEAVIFFFVLSGFVLTRSLSSGPQEPVSSSCRFIVARIFRIYPAVIASVAVFAAASRLAGWGPQATSATVIANMLLLDVSLNGVMWSLQLEVLAIPLILGAYLVLSRSARQGPYLVATLATALVALSFVGRWTRLLEPSGASLGFMYAFVFGVLVAPIGARVAHVLTPHRTTLAIAVWTVIFFAARPVLGPASNWRVIVNALSAAALTALVSFGPRVALLKVLDARAIHFVGRVSFSFYLLHPLMLIVLWQIPGPLSRLLDVGVPNVILAIALLGLSAAATAVLAAVFYRFIEESGIAAGRSLLPPRRAA